MEQNLESRADIKSRILNFCKFNKVKIFTLVFFCFLVVVSFFLLNYKNEKSNILIAEKYIQAGVYLSANKRDKAKNLYEEIILSKNKFYSILSLNTIIENDLVANNEKVLNYFKLLEELNYPSEKKDLIFFKKALYLIKSSKQEEGERLLKNLINDNSQFKVLAEEIIKN